MLRSEILQLDPWNTIPQCVQRCKTLSSHAKQVYSVLLNCLRDNENCWPSITSLASQTGLSKRTVIRSIKILQNHKLVFREARINKSTIYTLNLPTELIEKVQHNTDSETVSIMTDGQYNTDSETVSIMTRGQYNTVPLACGKRRREKEEILNRRREGEKPSAVDNIVSLFKDCWTKAGLNHLENISDSTLGKLIKPVLKSDPDFKDRIKPLCEKVSAGKFLKTLSISTILKRSKDNHELFNYEIILDGQWDDRKSSSSTFDPNRGIITQEQLRADLAKAELRAKQGLPPEEEDDSWMLLGDLPPEAEKVED